jgi:predicted nucleic acid-binding protein
MILIDTTVLVEVLRDKSGVNAERLLAVLGTEDVAFTRFTELKVLMGAKDEAEWNSIRQYLAARSLLDPSASSWADAARTYYDLRRAGRTVRSIVDCCIARMAIENDLTLLHNDRDFETIAAVRPFKHQRVQLAAPPQGSGT